MSDRSFEIEELLKYKMYIGVDDVFESVQSHESSCGRDRFIEILFTLYKKTERKTDFHKEFLLCLGTCLTYDKTVRVEDTLKFAAHYCVHHLNNIDPTDLFILVVFKFLFKNHNNSNTYIRLRFCQFINAILDYLGPEAVLDDDIFTSLAECMLLRLRDKSTSVRAQAVMALQRLQEPHEKDCQIIRALAYHMEYDPSSEVRGKVVCHVAFTPRTLGKVLGRIQDRNATVRKQTLRALIRLKLLRFSLKQRQTLFTMIFRDVSRVVQGFGKTQVITKWFKDDDCNILSFLKKIDVVSFELNQQLLYCLFDKMPVTGTVELMESLQVNRVIPLKEITPESAVFWRHLLSYLDEKSFGDVISEDDLQSRVVPELTPFTKYIDRFAATFKDLKQDIDKEFIFCQLLEIASTFSLSDEMGREELRKLCMKLLKSKKVGTSAVPVLARVMKRVVPSVESRMSYMAEIVADIREPLESDQTVLDPQQVGEIEEIGDRLSNLHCSSQTQNLDEVEQRESRDDPVTVCKYLTVIKEFLKASDVTSIGPTVLTLKQLVVAPCMQISECEVACLVIDVLTLMALRNKDIALEIFDFLCLQICSDSLCVSATEAVFDLLCIYGFTLVRPIDVEENDSMFKNVDNGVWPTIEDFMQDKSLDTPEKRRIVPLLTFLLKSTVREVKIVACQGLCKLFLSRRLNSPVVLGQLTLFWFEPFSEMEGEVRQPMCLFFSAVAKGGLGGLLVDALIPSVRAVFDSPGDSEIANVDPEGIVRLYLTLLSPANLPQHLRLNKEGVSWHWAIGEMMVDELLETGCQMVFVLAKALDALEIDPAESSRAQSLLGKLIKVVRILKSTTKERKSLNSLLSFKTKLEKLLSGDFERSTNNKGDRVSDSFDSTAITGSVLCASKLSSLAEVEEDDGVSSAEDVPGGVGEIVPGTPSTETSEISPNSVLNNSTNGVSNGGVVLGTPTCSDTEVDDSVQLPVKRTRYTLRRNKQRKY